MSKTAVLCLKILFLLQVLGCHLISSSASCGDWTSFGDSLCFKVYHAQDFHTFRNATSFCSVSSDPTSGLPVITHDQQQAFLVDYLFTQNRLVDDVWLGARFDPSSQSFKWTKDGAPLTFTNWAPGRPLNQSDTCLQMGSDGKWADKPCGKKNLVVCERTQQWTLGHLQELVTGFKEKFDLFQNEFVRLNNELNSTKQALVETQEDLARTKENLGDHAGELNQTRAHLTAIKHKFTQIQNQLSKTQQNPVPIGFIYVQLPKELAPSEIWSWMAWRDISPTYEGVFFRVTGGTAEPFGGLQEENSPRLTSVHSEVRVTAPSDQKKTLLPVGGCSNWMYTGGGLGESKYKKFCTSGGEVRPRNMAIKIWKRVE